MSVTTSGSAAVHQIICASAGCGKTQALTNRYLRLILRGVEPGAVLATTFTRKAAGEILERLLGRLADAARDAHRRADLAQQLDIGALSHEQVQSALCRLARRLDQVQICTLDSFFVRIVGVMGLELGLPPAWRLIDEHDQQTLIVRAVGAAIDNVGHKELAAWTPLIHGGAFKRPVHGAILDKVQQLWSIHQQAPPEVWRWAPEDGGPGEAAIARAISELGAVQAPLTKAGTPNTNWARALTELRMCLAGRDWAELIALTLCIKVIDGEAQFSRADISDDVRGKIQLLIDAARVALLTQLAQQTAAYASLMGEFDTAYRRLQLAQGALGFDDLKRAIAAGAIAGRLDEVYYRLDSRVQHLLIDEFQDTSLTDWSAISPLAEEIVAYADGSRSFFCVGDVKQAIYGWRGGEAALMGHIQRQWEQAIPQRLDVSRRSAPPVIEAVNRVFGDIAGNPAWDGDQAVERAASSWAQDFLDHQTHKLEAPGHVTLRVAPATDEPSKEQAWSAAALLAAGLLKQTPSKSIAILTRDNKALAGMARRLTRLNVPVSIEGRSPIVESPVVEWVLSALTLADHPGDTACACHVRYSPLGEKFELTDYASAAQRRRVAGALRGDLLKRGYGHVVARMVDTLAPYAQPHDAQRLGLLVDLAHRYDLRAALRPTDFVRLARSYKTELLAPAQVRLMTIYQSKGLDFDAVILPDLEIKIVDSTKLPAVLCDRPDPVGAIARVAARGFKDLRRIWPDGARLEQQWRGREVQASLCLLYVAMTRAKQALHMIVSAPRPKKSGDDERKTPMTFAGLLCAALAPDQSLSTEGGQTLYEQGAPDCLAGDDAPSRAVEALAPLGVQWKQAPGAGAATRNWRRQTPSELASQGRPESAASLFSLTRSTAARRGVLVHSLVESVEWLDDAVPDAQAFLDARPELKDEESGQAAAWLADALAAGPIREALTRKMHAAWKAARLEVRCEQSFVFREGSALLEGKMDRLVVGYDASGAPQRAQVIDYKTDQVVAGQDLTAHYRPQLEAYRRAAAMLTGLPAERVSAKLLLLEVGRVVEL